MSLNQQQEDQCSQCKWNFSDLSALFLNCTLKKSPERSHTRGLIDISKAIMEKNGVTTECLRPIDHDIATGCVGVPPTTMARFMLCPVNQ